jgi:hypothetical protein
MMDNPHAACLACGRTSGEVTLLLLEYRGSQLRICPQCLPVLIHQPGRLEESLPGASGFPRPGTDLH